MKNSNDTIWNRTSDLPICSTAPWPLCHRGPRVVYYKYQISSVGGQNSKGVGTNNTTLSKRVNLLAGSTHIDRNSWSCHNMVLEKIQECVKRLCQKYAELIVSSNDCGQNVWELMVPVEMSVWLYLYDRAYIVCMVGNVCRTSGEEFALFVTTDCNMLLTFRHRASCILGQAFLYTPENAFYIFNQQIYFIIWYLLDRASLI